MFWKPRKTALTISAELHEKLVQSCVPINSVDSEVLRVRSVHSSRTRQSPEEKRRHRMLYVGR